MHKQFIFPTTIWTSTLTLDTNRLAESCYDFQRRNQGVAISNVNGYHSKNVEDEKFVDLKQSIMDHVDQCGLGKKMKMQNLWINVNGPGSFNSLHTHPGSVLSGAYYVKVPEGDCGSIVLHRNPYESFLLETTPHDSKSAENWGNIKFKPRENFLLLFPSWIQHEVTINKTAADRISVSFNVY